MLLKRDAEPMAAQLLAVHVARAHVKPTRQVLHVADIGNGEATVGEDVNEHVGRLGGAVKDLVATLELREPGERALAQDGQRLFLYQLQHLNDAAAR